MDTSDPDIRFDADGVSHWWHEFRALQAARPSPSDRARQLDASLRQIREQGRGKPYDCVVGLSGGVDSSYVAVLAKEWGLRPLVVHFDNGWNDELAVANIQAIVGTLKFPLHTFVMNWPEFRDLQRAYFKASVLDLEVPTDHMIVGAVHRVAAAHRIKHILSGTNFATEWLLPRAWYYPKLDLGNIRGIHRAYGELPMKHLPRFGAWQRLYYHRRRGVTQTAVLDLIEYRKTDAKRLLIDRFGWRDYGGKHFESVFTRFYQGVLLPEKFGIDKRKAHLSNLICNGEMTREAALRELAVPTYEPDRQKTDRRYVAKKLGWSDQEFQQIVALPPRRHEEFGTETNQRRLAGTVDRFASLFTRAVTWS